jgi:regulator of ribonuclease activity A
MMDFYTADLCDTYHDSIAVLESGLFSYGGEVRFCGPITTIKLDEDNSDLIKLLKEDGKGRVAVVDVLGSYCAVVGDTLMGFAVQHNWAGIIINGYVRDIENTQHMRVGLLALGTCPRKSQKRSPATLNEAVTFLGVTFKEGDYVYVDSDGVVVSAQGLLS